MKKLKDVVAWILNVYVIAFGFSLFQSAQSEISSNPWYTWRRPYSSYEQEVITTRWIGLVLLIAGLIFLLFRLFMTMYNNRHIEEATPMARKDGTIKCSVCGLELVANTKTCPRCSTVVKENKF